MAAISQCLQLREPQISPRVPSSQGTPSPGMWGPPVLPLQGGWFGSCSLCHPVWLVPNYPKLIPTQIPARCGAQGGRPRWGGPDEGESTSTVHFTEFFFGVGMKNPTPSQLLFISTALTRNSTFKITPFGRNGVLKYTPDLLYPAPSPKCHPAA